MAILRGEPPEPGRPAVPGLSPALQRIVRLVSGEVFAPIGSRAAARFGFDAARRSPACRTTGAAGPVAPAWHAPAGRRGGPGARTRAAGAHQSGGVTFPRATGRPSRASRSAAALQGARFAAGRPDGGLTARREGGEPAELLLDPGRGAGGAGAAAVGRRHLPRCRRRTRWRWCSNRGATAASTARWPGRRWLAVCPRQLARGRAGGRLASRRIGAGDRPHAAAARSSSTRSATRSTIRARATSRTSASRRPATWSRVLVHPVSGDTAGDIVLVDMDGRATTISSGWNSVLGLAWAPGGQEVWFTGTRTGAAQAIHAVSRSGQERLILSAPATLTLHDIAPDGRALVTRDAWGAGVMVRARGSASERDLSWLDGSTAWDLSPDGTTAVFEESWEGGGAARSIYLRTTDGAPAVRLGDGVPIALSPDKQWVLWMPVAADRLVLLPTGVGQARSLPTGPIARSFRRRGSCPTASGSWSRRRKDRPTRIYLQSIDGGDPQPLTAEGEFGRIAVFPAGDRFVTRDHQRQLAVFAVGGGEPGRWPGPSGPTSRSSSARTASGCTCRATVTFRLRWRASTCASGRREPVRALLPPDPAGTMDILRILMTPDAGAYAYTFVRALSALYLVDGLQ